MKFIRIIKSSKSSALNIEENIKLVRKSMAERGIEQLITHDNMEGIGIQFWEENGDQFLSIFNRGIKFDDKLAQILSKNLNKNISFYDTDILETIYKID